MCENFSKTNQYSWLVRQAFWGRLEKNLLFSFFKFEQTKKDLNITKLTYWKALVEKLLSSCFDIEKIYILVRHKKGIDSSERLIEFFKNENVIIIPNFKSCNRVESIMWYI